MYTEVFLADEVENWRLKSVSSREDIIKESI
jgi:hypothetical protein